MPRRSHGFRNFILPLVLRAVLLFTFGIAYGVIITHLHDNQTLAPVKVENLDRHSWSYLVFWGISGVALGSLLPWFDVLWDDTVGAEEKGTFAKGLKGSPRTTRNVDERPPSRSGNESGVGADWTPIVRSVGAFIGIAFAIASSLLKLHMTELLI
jgi:hypothetical protein